jgi:hypothetical protein
MADKLTYPQLLQRYRDKHGTFVKPNQGWASLDSTLWLAYSMGRRRGFTDLGTYAEKPGDHGYWPALAFDLGRNNRFFNKGWNYLVARKLALLYVENHKALSINYVILGRRIWSRKYPYWHPLTTGDTSHDWHIHVSGIHPTEGT